MREIKFRAWDKLDREMREVPCINNFDEMASLRLSEKPSGFVVNRKMSDVELMQYTGLKDIYDVEVYQGDILKVCGTNTGYGGGNFVNIEEVKWDDEQACWSFGPMNNTNAYTFRDIEINDYEIIGNIYSNPELL